MKKLSSTLCAILCVFSLIACAQNKKSEATMKNEVQKKILVAYFSATGTTKQVASQLSQVMNADLHEIKPETAYTVADLDWNNQQSRSTVEMKNPKSRPAITEKIKNMNDYDIVFIGFPIWWYTAPTIINTFIESYDMKGKTLIPFATSGGSSIDKACHDLKHAYPSLAWQTGRLLNHTSDADLEAWKKELAL